MQRSALIIILFSLFTFFSPVLASPFPVQAAREVKGATVELSTRDVPVDLKILHREVATGTGSGISLDILAREHQAFEYHAQETTGETNVARDTRDLGPRICRGRMCI